MAVLHTINEIKGRLRMLTHHQKPTRRTTRAGLAGITALALTGLALTASGTRAAENLKAKVEDKIGVRIADIELPQLPEPPAPPAEPEAPAALPPLPAVPNAAPGRDVRVYKMKDGKRTIVVRHGDPVDPAEMARLSADTERLAADAERMAANIRVPEIREMRCGGNGPTSISTATADGRSIRRTVICTDRIERAAREGARAAADAGRTRAIAIASARSGMATARASIELARTHVRADRSISDQERQTALDALDEAMSEIESEPGE